MATKTETETGEVKHIWILYSMLERGDISRSHDDDTDRQYMK